MSENKFTIASRGSKLAMWQAKHVQSLLKDKKVDADILEVQTTGDKVQDRFLHEIGGKGLFVKEVEQALLDGKAHLAIHSLKDLPVKTPEPFELTTILKRHSPYDAMIFRKDSAQRVNLKPELVIGKEDIMLMGDLTVATGSLRRSSLLKEASNTVKVLGIRGNVDTRLQKLVDNKEWDAIILAEASLDRLGLGADLVVKRLDPEWFVPSASQGALVIETKKDGPLNRVIKELDCETSHRMIDIERKILEELGGDCTMPFGCHFSFEKRDGSTDVLVGRTVILAEDGTSARADLAIPVEYDLPQEKIVLETLKRLKDDGGVSIIDKLKIDQPSW
ncbi:hydroxymethylbilane synthase [bacterium]|nr:hydroxymethylbilane synthase [bacterium]